MGSQKWCFCILAAGQGKRMFSKTPKVILPALGRPLLHYLLDRCSLTRFSGTVLVVSPAQRDTIRQAVFPEVELVNQDEPLGTAHALRCALPSVPPETDYLLVVYADMPLLNESVLEGLMSYTEQSQSSVVLMSAHASYPTGYGRVVRNTSGEPVRIVEEKDCTPEQKGLTEINLGIYAFRRDEAETILTRVDHQNAQMEYYLTDCLEVSHSLKRAVQVYLVPWTDEFQNVNTPADFSRVLRCLRDQKNQQLLEQGVKILDPGTTYLDWDCTVEPDCWLYPGTVIEGKSHIGAGSVIGPYCRISDSQMGVECRVEFSVVERSVMGNRVQVGPYAHLRPGSHIGNNVRIGNFVEVKQTQIDEGTKALHLSYLGDASVGKNANIGAGTITCNYDGQQKHRTIIEDRVFIGSNNSLVAPVRIGEGSYTAAGSIITRDVPPGALGVGRTKQINKEGWAKRRTPAGGET